jgi:LuxR family maltose regulon positive regulatory protein
LIEKLERGAESGFVLVSAPAGYGKTTLLSAWLRSLSSPAVWYSVDEGDNDPPRFLAYLSAALEKIEPALGELVSLGTRTASLPGVEAVLTPMINRLAKTSQPFWLVLDDYHLIQNPYIHEAVSFLIAQRPAPLHLAIATRADPPLPLARLRARSQMVEVRLTDLRFTTQEVSDFLRTVMRLDLTAAEVSMLETSTEGWVAGLQMAGLSLQGREDASAFIRSSSGENRYILDFLFEEVFQHQNREIQDFLLRTSVLEQLCGSLCDAVNLREDGQAMLGLLERRNLFLIPLDDQRKWYRYHHLFSELLQSRLKQTFPDEIAPLHQRASAWYAAENNLESAIGHALDSGDYLLVNELVSGNVLAMMEHAELIGVLRRFERMPASEMEAKPWLGVAYAWTKAYVGPSEELDLKLGQIESGFIAVEDTAEKRRLTSHLDAIRAYRAWVKGGAEQALRYARRSLENLPEDDWMARCHILNIEGLAHQYLLDLKRAVQSFEAAILAGQRTPRPYETLHSYTNLAFARILQGELHQAHSLCQYVFDLAEQSGEPAARMPVLAYAFATLSQVQLQWNDAESALSNARHAVSLAGQWNQADTLHYALTCLAEAMSAAGNLEGAFEVNQRAMQLARNASPWFFRISAFLEIKLNLAKGNARVAASLLEQIEPLVEVRDQIGNFVIVKTAVFLALGRFADVVLTLDEPVCELERQGRKWPLMELLPCLALALHAMGRREEAQDVISRSLTLAAPERFVYTFVKWGEPMHELLLESLKRGVGVDFVQQMLPAFHVREAAQMRERHPVSPAASRFSTSALPDPLTQREMDVLRLLAQHYSDKQIAQSLFIARETVHKHLKHIYEKLAVHRRAEAVTRARELGLL